MPIYEVDAPNGKTYRVEGPENARPDDIGRSFMINLYPGILESEKPKPERGIGQLFSQGFGRGVEQTKVLLGDYLPALAGRGVQQTAEALGAESVAGAAGSFAERQLREAAQSEAEIAKKYPREFQSYEDVTGPISALRYGAEALGEGLPSIVPGIVTGGAGAIAARGLQAGARAAATALATGAGSAAQTVPEAYASILRETGKEEIGASLIAGGINAALESVLPAGLISKMGGPAKEALVGSIKKRLGLGFAEGAVMEGLTEGAQEAVNQAAISFVDQNKEFFTSENWKEILDNAIRGAIVGGTVSGGTNVAFGRRTAEQPTPEGTPAATVEGAPQEVPAGATEFTPEQKTFVSENLPLLANLGYQPQEISNIPFDALKDIVVNKTPAETYFGKGQVQPKTPEPAPAPEGQVTPAPTEPVTPAPTEPVTPAPTEPVTPAPTEPVTPAPAPEVTPAPAPAPEVTPAPAPTPAPVQTASPVFDLPKNLAGAKPGYNFGTTEFQPVFANGVDKALYITANPKKSKSDAQYRGFLRDLGFINEQIDSYGKSLLSYMRGQAKTLIENGENGGPLPIDYMRTVHPDAYNNITKGVLTPVAPTTPKAPEVPYTPKAPPPMPSPFGGTPSGVKQVRAQIRMTPRVENILEKALPGSSGVLRTLIQGFLPGTRIQVKSQRVAEAYGNIGYFTGKAPLDKPQFTLRFDVERIRERMTNPESAKAYFLKTIFHELSHAIEFTHLANSSPEVIESVIDQYAKEKNVSSVERFVLFHALANPNKINNPNFLEKTLKAAGLTREQYDAFVKSSAKKVPVEAGKDVTKTPVGEDYQRSFSEWIAETGARWMTKELNNLVPKTTFEKFQKSVLDNLRNLYQQISKMLGVTPTEGAFEKLLRDVYGNRATTPESKEIPRTTPRFEEIIRTPDKKVRASINRVMSNRDYTNSDLETVGVAPTAVDQNAKEPPAPKGPAAQQPTKTYNDLKYLLAPDDKSMTGFVGRTLRSIVGANPGESISRAFVRNVVNSNVPFLEREDLRNLGKMIEGLMNSTGRVMGTVLISPMGYNRATKSFYFHSGSEDKSLKDIFAKVGTKYAEQFQIVALASRELALRKERGVYVKGNNGETVLPEGITRLSNKDLQDVVNTANPIVKEALAEFQKFNDKMIEMSVQAGLIPRNLAERFKTLMYTPMYRVQEQAMKDDPNIGIFGGIIDALKDPQGVTAYKNKVGTLETGAINGNFYENILRNYNAIVSAAVRNVAYQETANTLTKIARDGGDTSIAEVFDKPSQGTIQYRVNGEDRYMKIYDPSMFQAIAALSPQQKNMFVRAMGWFTGLLRKGVTATPPFQLRNLIRGLVELKIKTGMPITTILRGTLDGAVDTWRKGGAYRDILGDTGFGGFGFGSGSADQAAYLQRLYKSRELSWTQWQKYPNAFMRLFDVMESLGEVTEMAPRIAYYNYLLRNGVSKNDATWEAVNLVNYHRHGAGNGVLGNAVSNMIPLIPFLTARIQGLYRLAEKGTEGGKTAFGRKLEKEDVLGIPKAILSRGMMVLAINAMVNMMYGDDDWYKKLSVKDRLSNMYVKIGDAIVVLPRAFEVGELFGGIPTLAFDSMRKQNGNDVTQGFLQFLSNTFMVEPIPQAFKPIAELVANKNFYTGLAIENLSDKRSPKEERFDEYTSSLAKMAGHIGKYVELSPKQIDTLLRGYLGTTATLFLGTFDALIGSAGTKPQGIFGDPNTLTGAVANLTGVAAILKDQSQLNNKFIGDFYEVKQKVTEVVQSMNDAATRNDTETIKSRIEQMPQARGLYTSFNSAGEQLSKINKQMEIIRGRSDMTPDQKTQMLEQLRTIKGRIAEQMVATAERVGVTR